MEKLACCRCPFVGEIDATDDRCPKCRKRGTLVRYEAVAWALDAAPRTPALAR